MKVDAEPLGDLTRLTEVEADIASARLARSASSDREIRPEPRDKRSDVQLAARCQIAPRASVEDEAIAGLPAVSIAPVPGALGGRMDRDRLRRSGAPVGPFGVEAMDPAGSRLASGGPSGRSSPPSPGPCRQLDRSQGDQKPAPGLWADIHVY